MIVALVSDVHANLMALLAVFRDLEQVEDERGLQIGAIWCMGDIAGYGPHLSAVLLKILSDRRPWKAIRGNHDDALLAALGAPASVDDAEVPETTRHAALRAIQLQSAEVSPAHRGVEWLGALPDVLAVRKDILLIHPSDGRHGMDPSSDPNESVLSVAAEHAALQRRFAPGIEPFTVVRGHTHVPGCLVSTPGTRRWSRMVETDIVDIGDRHAWINPGSVGESRVAGDPRAHYALLDTARRRLEFRRVSYPVKPVRLAARAAGYHILPAWQAVDGFR